jgi:hypothetical protein
MIKGYESAKVDKSLRNRRHTEAVVADLGKGSSSSDEFARGACGHRRGDISWPRFIDACKLAGVREAVKPVDDGGTSMARALGRTASSDEVIKGCQPDLRLGCMRFKKIRVVRQSFPSFGSHRMGAHTSGYATFLQLRRALHDHHPNMVKQFAALQRGQACIVRYCLPFSCSAPSSFFGRVRMCTFAYGCARAFSYASVHFHTRLSSRSSG